MKSGNMNVGKANAKLLGSQGRRSYVSQTQTGQIGQNVGPQEGQQAYFLLSRGLHANAG